MRRSWAVATGVSVSTRWRCSCVSRIDSSSCASGIADRDPHQESVELALRERIGPFRFDRVLGGDHHERDRQAVAVSIDGDLLLGHRLEESGLGLGRCTVDLVGQHDVVEHRALSKLERGAVPLPHADAGDISGQEVGSELDTAPFGLDGLSQRLGDRRLAHTGHVLDQQVPFGQEAQKRLANDDRFAPDDLFHVVSDGIEGGDEPGHPGTVEHRSGVRRRGAHTVGVGCGGRGHQVLSPEPPWARFRVAERLSSHSWIRLPRAMWHPSIRPWLSTSAERRWPPVK